MWVWHHIGYDIQEQFAPQTHAHPPLPPKRMDKWGSDIKRKSIVKHGGSCVLPRGHSRSPNQSDPVPSIYVHTVQGSPKASVNLHQVISEPRVPTHKSRCTTTVNALITDAYVDTKNTIFSHFSSNHGRLTNAAFKAPSNRRAPTRGYTQQFLSWAAFSSTREGCGWLLSGVLSRTSTYHQAKSTTMHTNSKNMYRDASPRFERSTSSLQANHSNQRFWGDPL